MKLPLLKPLLPVALMLSAILGLTGCFEELTVVKINKVGSGLIHVRKYKKTLAGKGLFGGLGGGEEKEEQSDSGEGAREPFADGPDDPQMMAMMLAIFAGAKFGFFVEIDGEIAETDAKHREGKMITIMRADLGKLFANPEAMKKLEGMDGNNRKEIQKIVDSLEGADMDLQDPITVKLK